MCQGLTQTIPHYQSQIYFNLSPSITFTFTRRFYPKRLTIAFRLYIFISTYVPLESNPQPFAQLTQCSTTEPHRNTIKIRHLNLRTHRLLGV